MEQRISILPKELSSKIFYYIGNNRSFVKELKNVMSLLSDEKFYSDNIYNFSRPLYIHYSSYLENEIYNLDISYNDFSGDHKTKKKLNISSALLLSITRRPFRCLEIESTILSSLGFDVFDLDEDFL